jgi:hypothetical protein
LQLTEVKRVTVMSCTLLGIEAQPVEVHLLAQPGSTGIQLHGLSPQTARESREQVRAALNRLSFELPACTIAITFDPAQLGLSHPSAHDLAIALGLLALSGHVSPDVLQGRLICGELALDGAIRSVRGRPLDRRARRAARCRGGPPALSERSRGDCPWSCANRQRPLPDRRCIAPYGRPAQRP